jgi:hypothetical protein
MTSLGSNDRNGSGTDNLLALSDKALISSGESFTIILERPAK